MKHLHWKRIAIALVVAWIVTLIPSTVSKAQGTSRTFPETGKSVQGKFLTYWDTHGGLAQQGYPISDEMQEKSDTDGKVYTVQYFERAEFELHPENQPPNDVLLSLLGVSTLKQRYPNGTPPQVATSDTDAIHFAETSNQIEGSFANYWKTHGGLEQQGYPITDMFQEVSLIDGKTYQVQYFERAVFEAHPENQPPNDVLLSQLGTFQYKAKYSTPSPTPTVSLPSPTATATAPAPTNTPIATPTVDIYSCDGVPPTSPDAMEISPKCLPLFETVGITGLNFPNDREVGIWATEPNGYVLGAPFQVPTVAGNNKTVHVLLTVDDEDAQFGVWTITMQGVQSGRTVYGYFKLVPQGTNVPDN